MSELAFNQNGDLFEVPAVVTAWRVRRLKPRGAPELVYGKDGRPLTISIEADMQELRNAVSGVVGKYRLDPVNDDGKVVEGTSPAYVHVVKAEATDEAASSDTAIVRSGSDDIVREVVRANSELAKAVVEKFSDVMLASAEMMRISAGLPPRKVDEDDEDDGDASDAVAAPTSSPAFEFINTLVAQVVPLAITSLTTKGAPKLGAIFDWRKAVPVTTPPPAQPEAAALEEPKAGTAVEVPPLDPKAMTHFIAIQSALTPAEAALARQVAAELSPAELHTWIGELSALSVPDAVAKIRTFIGETSKTGAPS